MRRGAPGDAPILGFVPALTVIRAVPEDLDQLVPLFGSYLSWYGRPAPSSDVERFLRARLSAGDSAILLATVDGEPVGFTQCYPTFSSLSLAPAWVLNDLFVSASARGTGAGRALLEAACAAAREAGAVYVALETAPDNAAARALYESASFDLDEEFLHYVRML